MGLTLWILKSNHAQFLAWIHLPSAAIQGIPSIDLRRYGWLVTFSQNTSPTYGDPFGGSGTAQTGFGFTGEQTDASGLVYLRARYYVPGLGVFPSLDPVEEGNRYGYVGENVVNRVDPSGEYWWKNNLTPPFSRLIQPDKQTSVSGLVRPFN